MPRKICASPSRIVIVPGASAAPALKDAAASSAVTTKERNTATQSPRHRYEQALAGVVLPPANASWLPHLRVSMQLSDKLPTGPPARMAARSRALREHSVATRRGAVV